MTNEKKRAIRAKITAGVLDGAIWVTDHIKEIGISAGLLGLAAVSHRMGYRKAQRDMASGFDKAWCTMLEGMIRGGDEWTK